jgi:hypothetical protein
MPVRSYAIMHAAMFDAVNSIDGSYTSYLTDVPGSQNASIEAAAAQAAHDVLVGLVSRRVRESSIRSSRSRFRESMRIERNKEFVSVQIVAERMLAARANDWLERNTACVQSTGQLPATGSRDPGSGHVHTLSFGDSVWYFFGDAVQTESTAALNECHIRCRSK